MTIHYIDPAHPTLTTQQQVTAAENAIYSTGVNGDSIFFMAGDHAGPVTFSKTFAFRVGINGPSTGTPARISGQIKWGPTAKNMLVRYIHFHGVDPNAGPSVQNRLADIFAGAQDIGIDRCKFYTELDASLWTWNDWVYKPYMTALLNRGERCNVTNCEFFNLRSALSMSGVNGLAEFNNIHDIGVDFIQVNGTWNRIKSNTLRFSMCTWGMTGSPEPLHGDFIQFYPATAPALNAYNTVSFNDLDATGSLGDPMGICNFDGRPKTIKVLDNIVRVKTWNGIVFKGTDGIEIARNTVDALDPAKKARIEVSASKTLVDSTGINVHDNIMLNGASFAIAPAGTPYS